jgi:hypothetical protein
VLKREKCVQYYPLQGKYGAEHTGTSSNVRGLATTAFSVRLSGFSDFVEMMELKHYEPLPIVG